MSFCCGVRKQEITSDHGGVLEQTPHTRITASRLLSLVRRIVHAISRSHRRCERVSGLPQTHRQFSTNHSWPVLHASAHRRGFSEPFCGTRRLQRQSQIRQESGHSALETITWCSPSNPPDADTTVLVFVPDADEPIDFGFWDGERWCCATLLHREESRIAAWAELPEGRIP